MKRIRYLGLDMDHTLIRYNSSNFESLAFEVMLKKLVETKQYPKKVLDLKFDYNRAIRGLVIDRNHGNILKLSRHAAIRVSYHGLEPIDYKDQKRFYGSTYIDLGDPEYDTVDTTFSIAFATLFAQLVDLKDLSKPSELPDYNQIANDLNYVLDQGHRDGSIKDVVANDMSRFVIKDPDVVTGLERFKKHDKKIFIVTNSDYDYTRILLDYAINPLLKEHDDWSELFEFVITSAQKPRFFFDKLKFLKIDKSTGSMANLVGPIEPGIYQGGCATTFTNDLDINPDEILYIGDHIYGDIVRLKKDCAWRTALIVEELQHEIDAAIRAGDVSAEINTLMEEKIPLEREIDDLISRRIELNDNSNEEKISALLERIAKIDRKISPLIRKRESHFNSYWGEVMHVGIEESFFAHQVERFACIYMSKLEDFLNNNPRTYYRAPKRQMAHEIITLKRDVNN